MNAALTKFIEEAEARCAAATPGTEALVLWLQTHGDRPVAQAEAIRRVRAHDRVREYANRVQESEPENHYAATVLALLDGDGA